MCVKTNKEYKNLTFSSVNTSFLTYITAVTCDHHHGSFMEADRSFFTHFYVFRNMHNTLIITAGFWVKNCWPIYTWDQHAICRTTLTHSSLSCPLLQPFVVHWVATHRQLGVSALLKGTFKAVNSGRGEWCLFSSSSQIFPGSSGDLNPRSSGHNPFSPS